MKDNFTRAEVKNLKHGALVGGVILGTALAIGAGVVIKKTTKCNLTDGTTGLFDKIAGKIREAIDSHKDAIDTVK